MLADRVPARPGSFFPNPTCTWWPDLLRPYQNTTNLLACPSVRSGFGIAMNHPDIGRWLVDPMKISRIKRPVDTLVLADAGLITNPTQTNPDLWVEQKDMQQLYFRTPLNDLSGGYYASDPQRAFNRHSKRCTGAFADCHAAAFVHGDGHADRSAHGSLRFQRLERRVFRQSRRGRTTRFDSRRPAD